MISTIHTEFQMIFIIRHLIIKNFKNEGDCQLLDNFKNYFVFYYNDFLRFGKEFVQMMSIMKAAGG